MSTLGDNMQLGYEAAKYAKFKAPRSGNQKYYKKWRPRTNKDRNLFMLGYMRGGSIQVDIDGNTRAWSQNTEVENNRKVVAHMFRTTPDKKEQDRQLDNYIKILGATYFLSGETEGFSFQGVNGSKSNMTKANQIQLTHRTDLTDEQLQKIAKRVGKPVHTVRNLIWGNDNAWQDLMSDFDFKESVHQSAKVGIGNCGEKADLAASYLLDRTPGGKRITVYSLDNDHKLFGHPGDHAFVVLGHDVSSQNVGTLGNDAVIVDGWMNDVYPAQKYLQWAYGYNYDNKRINIKQLNIRTLICKFYRSHIQVSREFGVPVNGPTTINRPTVTPRLSNVA